MNRPVALSICLSLILLGFQAPAKMITVNTVNNASPPAGQTNLAMAIQLLEDGDTIRFDIAGPGPHFLVTPAMVLAPGGGGGYPEITKNNVTIDGYSQPGAAPNTNPILSSNNAQIKIVLDSRTGGGHVWDISGYGTSEAGMLVVSGNNVTIKGLSFIGAPGTGDDTSPSLYAVALGNRGGNSFHLSGCWIGVAPDGKTVAGMNDGVTGFRHRDPSDVLVNNTVIGVKPGATNPRAEFNVIVDLTIPVIIEGAETRASGNFIGVLPDGLTRVPNPSPERGWEGHFELARNPYNIVIGTDGDGVNDADERNVLSGGVHGSLGSFTTEATYDHIIEFYGGGTRTNNVIAGNYIGVGVDGKTLFTNATRLINGWGSTADVRIGSDFDGISDDLEGNVIAGNNPFSEIWPTPAGQIPPEFMGVDVGERVSLRGNTLMNASIAPFSYPNGQLTNLEKLTNYYAPFLSVSNVIPQLSTNLSQGRLRGVADVGLDPYTNLVVDVYVADSESWTNGRKFELSELWYTGPSGETLFDGFAVGRTYLRSFADNGPQDLNPAPGAFEFDIGLLNAPAGAMVTVTANYLADSPGTRNARTHTSLFAKPVALPVLPKLALKTSGSALLLSWPAAAGTMRLQSTTSLTQPAWTDLTPQPQATQVGDDFQVTIPAGSGTLYLRGVQSLSN